MALTEIQTVAIADDAVTTDKLANAINTDIAAKMPLAGGTFTGDVTFDNATHAGFDITWDESEKYLLFQDATKIVMGSGGDLSLYHDGSHSYLIDGGTGDLIINSNSTVRINPNAGGEYGFAVHSNGACEAFYDNSKKFETTANGITVTGGVTTTTGSSLTSDGVPLTVNSANSNNLKLEWEDNGTTRGYLGASSTKYLIVSDGSANTRVEVDSGGVTVTDDLTVTNDVKLADDGKLICGNSSDLKIYHDGTDTFIKNTTGNILIGDTDGNVVLQGKWGEDSLVCKPDGAVELNFDNNKKFETLTDGARVSGDCQISRNRFIGSISGGSSINIGTSGGSQVGFFEETGNHDSLRFYVHESGVSHGECARFSYRGALCIGTTTQEEPGNGNTTTGNVLKTNGRYFHSMPGTWGCVNRNDSDGTLMVFARGGTHVGHISVGSSSTAYNTTSDYRLKENEVIITDGITRLKQLKPYQFNWKTDSTNTKLDGFFAHEVSSIVPEAITGTKDEVYDEDDDEANIKKGDPLYQGIDQSKLVPLLTAALQEAITEIETLKTKVAALEAA